MAPAPKTGEGNAKSSMNAVKTGLTGRTVLLSTDDAVIYACRYNHSLTVVARFRAARASKRFRMCDRTSEVVRLDCPEGSLPWPPGKVLLRSQMRFKESSSVRRLTGGDVFRSARRHNFPARVSALRPQIDHVIGGLNDV